MPYPYDYDDEIKPYKQPKLVTNRSMWKLMILSILTCGIYTIIFFIPFSFDLDKVAPKPDRSKTMNYLFVHIIAAFTFSIVVVIWHYHVAHRVEEALSQRGIDYQFSTHDFWGWYIAGSLFLVGPFVYFHKLCKAMNLLCENYNENPVTA